MSIDKEKTRNDVTKIIVKHNGKELGKIEKSTYQEFLPKENIDEITLSKLNDKCKQKCLPVISMFLTLEELDKEIENDCKIKGIPCFKNKSIHIGSREEVSEHFIFYKIALDLKNKQYNLSKRLNIINNNDIISKNLGTASVEELANEIREKINFDINIFRKNSRTDAREYLISILHEVGIFVSLGTNAPGVQPLKSIEPLGAFWISNEYDPNSPWIYIDTRDDMDKKKIPIGRQIYGMVLMVVSYILNHKNVYIRQSEFRKQYIGIKKKLYDITSEILLPEKEIIKLINDNASSTDYDFIINNFEILNVTPTFLLKRMVDLSLLRDFNYDKLKEKIVKKVDELSAKSKKDRIRFNYTKTQMNYNNKYYMKEILKNRTKFPSPKMLSYALYGQEYSKAKLKDRILKFENLIKSHPYE